MNYLHIKTLPYIIWRWTQVWPSKETYFIYSCYWLFKSNIN